MERGGDVCGKTQVAKGRALQSTTAILLQPYSNTNSTRRTGLHKTQDAIRCSTLPAHAVGMCQHMLTACAKPPSQPPTPGVLQSQGGSGSVHVKAMLVRTYFGTHTHTHTRTSMLFNRHTRAMQQPTRSTSRHACREDVRIIQDNQKVNNKRQVQHLVGSTSGLVHRKTPAQQRKQTHPHTHTALVHTDTP